MGGGGTTRTQMGMKGIGKQRKYLRSWLRKKMRSVYSPGMYEFFEEIIDKTLCVIVKM